MDDGDRVRPPLLMPARAGDGRSPEGTARLHPSSPPDSADGALARFLALAWGTATATFALLLLGAAVVATGAGLSCPGWPLCGGHAVPALVGIVVVEWSHRVGALTVTLLSLITAAAAWPLRRQGPWAKASLAALVLLAAQVALGAFVVEDSLTPWLVVAHEGLGIVLLCVWIAVGALGVCRRSERRASAVMACSGMAGTRLPPE